LVRNPYDWYESFYNYVMQSPEKSKHDAISGKLMYNKDNSPISLQEYVYNATNMKKAFNKDSISLLNEEFVRRRNGYLKLQFVDYSNIQFEEESYYSYSIGVFVKEDAIIYRMEDEMSKYLKAIGVINIGEDNKSEHTSKLTDGDRKLIYEADKDLFIRFGYEE